MQLDTPPPGTPHKPPGPTPPAVVLRPDLRSPSHTPRNRGKGQKNRDRPPRSAPREQPIVEGTTWTPSDPPLFRLRDRWHLATDDALQWVLYRRRGQQWHAVSFPTTQAALLAMIRHHAASREGTLDGIDPAALTTIRGWPDGPFRRWLASTQH